MKFKVLRGLHNEGGKTYKQGDIVDSATDLNKMNAPQCVKFVQIGETVETEQSLSKDEDDGLDDMTVKELRSFAEEGDVDLVGTTSKAEIVQRIRQAMQGEAID